MANMNTEKITRFIVIGCGHTGTTLVSGILLFNGYRNMHLSRDLENRKLSNLCYRMINGDTVKDQEIRDFFDDLDSKTHGVWSIKSPHLSQVIARIYPLIKYPVKIIFHIRAPAPTVAHLLNERRVNWPDTPDSERLVSAEKEWLKRNNLSLEFLNNINKSPFLITDYDDMIEGEHDELLCRFAKQSLDLSFIEPRKRRSSPIPVSSELEDLYTKLTKCQKVNNAEVMQNYKAVPMRPRSKLKLGIRCALFRNRLRNAVYDRLFGFHAQKVDF